MYESELTFDLSFFDLYLSLEICFCFLLEQVLAND